MWGDDYLMNTGFPLPPMRDPPWGMEQGFEYIFSLASPLLLSQSVCFISHQTFITHEKIFDLLLFSNKSSAYLDSIFCGHTYGTLPVKKYISLQPVVMLFFFFLQIAWQKGLRTTADLWKKTGGLIRRIICFRLRYILCFVCIFLKTKMFCALRNTSNSCCPL